MSLLDSERMAANTGVLLVMLWTTCQLGVSQDIILPAQLGSPCKIDDRCNAFVKFSVCRNEVCACATNYVPDSLNTLCLPVITNLDDGCVEAIQCTKLLGPNADCKNNTRLCSCKPDHHIVFPSLNCTASKRLNEECKENTDCYLDDDGSSQHVECEQQECKCNVGYNPTPDNRSCKGSAATKIISITWLVGIWLLHLLM